jgi:hypothetical protein
MARAYLGRVMAELGLPISATWSYERANVESLYRDGTIKDGVAYFVGELRTPSRDMKMQISVPLIIHNGEFTGPALFIMGDKTSVFTREALADLFRQVQYPRPLLHNEYLYAPPTAGVTPPNQTLVDPLTGLR